MQRGQLLRLRKPEDVVKSNPSLVGWFLWDVGSGESKASPGFRWTSKPGAALGELSLSSLLQRHLQANTTPGQSGERQQAGGLQQGFTQRFLIILFMALYNGRETEKQNNEVTEQDCETSRGLLDFCRCWLPGTGLEVKKKKVSEKPLNSVG